MSAEAAASVVVPLDLLDAATELVAEFAGRRVVADFVEQRFGRRVVARLVSYEVIARVHHAAGQGLDTAGPLLAREVILVDKEPPHPPLAFCSALVVPDRLPAEVASALTTDAEPVDRLLTRYALAWQAELRPEEGFIGPFELASRDFSWLGADAGAAVELLRLVSVDGRPAAILVDELPLPAARRAAVPA